MEHHNLNGVKVIKESDNKYLVLTETLKFRLATAEAAMALWRMFVADYPDNIMTVECVCE